MSELTHHVHAPEFKDIKLSADDITIRQINTNDLKAVLRDGLADFNAKPGAFPFIFVFFPLFVVVFSLASLGQEMRYLAFPIVAGFTLLGPLVAVGFFELSRCREKGQPLEWGAMFRFIHTHSFAPLLAISLLMMVLYAAWLALAEMLFFGVFGTDMPATMSAFLTELFTTRQGWGLIAYGNLTGFLFAFAAMAISVVSFPLALDKPVTAYTAIKVSVKAFTSNFVTLAVWGLIVAALMALGTALFFIGLAFVLPILGHATWHLYRRLIL